MKEDILNYSPTVMFRGTPCNLHGNVRHPWSVKGLKELGMLLFTWKVT